MSEQDVRTVKTFCRICTTLCGVLVDVDGDQVVRARGDRDHPFTHGYMCSKGAALPQIHHHPDRIERPLMKIDGRLQPTTWEACLDDLADRLRAIIERHGPWSVGVFFGSGLGMDAAGYKMAEALHVAMGRPPRFSPLTIDGTAKPLIGHQMSGFPFTAHLDYRRARLVMFIGTNPCISHGHNIGLAAPASVLREVRTHGELWVIDPRQTESARLATHHIAPLPGTDYAILAYLIRELLRDGADREVLERRTVDKDALAAAVAPFTLEHAAGVAGIAESELTGLLASVRRAGTIAIETGTGVTMSPAANVTQWLTWALLIITGSMNRPGGIWFHPGFHMQFDAFELPAMPPNALFGPGPKSRPEAQMFLGEWPCAALPDEIAAGNIRAVLNLGGHLVAGCPDVNVLVPALKSLEVFATMEIIANETSALSTHVLPTKDQLERADVTLWDTLVPRVAVQHTPAVVKPVGDRRSTWWVLAELGRRLGHDLAPASGDAATDDARLAQIMTNARCTFDEVVSSGAVERDRELPAQWFEQYLDRLGGWRLAPQFLVDQLAALAPPPALAFIPRRQVRRLNSQLGYLGEDPEVIIHPDDAREAHIVDGSSVVVRSARGELTGVARIDGSVRRGVVSVPHGHERANVNLLTNKDVIDVVTGMVQYSGIAVSLHQVPTGI